MQRKTMAVLAWFLICTPSLSAAVSRPSTPTVTIVLLKDGAVAGQLLSFGGGVLSGPVVAGSSAGSTVKKYLGNPSYEDVTAVLRLPPPAPVLAWIQAALEGRPSVSSLVVCEVDARAAVLARHDLGAARLLSLTFDGTDAAVRTPIQMRLAIRPERVVRTVGGTMPPSAATPADRSSQPVTVGLTVSGLDASGLVACGSLCWTFAPTAVLPDGRGTPVPQAAPATPVAPGELHVVLDAERASTWDAWATSFMVQGTTDDASEKTVRLDFLRADSRPAFSLYLSGVGLFRYGREPVDVLAHGQRRVTAGLYVETLALTPPAGAAGPVPAPAEPAPAAEPTPSAAPAALVTTPALVALTPVAPAAGSPDDQGTRDVTDFPRFPDSVRLSYNGTRSKTSLDERAEYRLPIAPTDAIDRFAAQLEAAGWTEERRDETGDVKAETYSVNARFTTKTRAARVYVQVRKGDTILWLDVHTDLAALAAEKALGSTQR